MHNDLPWAIREQFGGDPAGAKLSAPVATTQTDLPRLAQGGVGARLRLPGAVRRTAGPRLDGN